MRKPAVTEGLGPWFRAGEGRRNFPSSGPQSHGLQNGDVTGMKRQGVCYLPGTGSGPEAQAPSQAVVPIVASRKLQAQAERGSNVPPLLSPVPPRTLCPRKKAGEEGVSKAIAFGCFGLSARGHVLCPLGSLRLPLGSDPLPGLPPESCRWERRKRSHGQAWPFKEPRFPPLGAEGSRWDPSSSTLLTGFWHSHPPLQGLSCWPSLSVSVVSLLPVWILCPQLPLNFSLSLGCLPGSLDLVLSLGLQLLSPNSVSGL